ncbi:MAG TPA: ferric reductase-like transmembrane domain-containing protein [Micromonosporaceae bacterium]
MTQRARPSHAQPGSPAGLSGWADPAYHPHPPSPRQPHQPGPYSAPPAGSAWSEAPPPPAAWPEPPPPPAAEGGRLFFLLLFWSGVATSLELWWLNTPVSALTTMDGALTGAGRVTGMLAGFALLTQILLMSRVRWLDRWIGATNLVAWHRRLGAFVVVAVLAHLVLIVWGYAALSEVSVVRQAWTMLTTYQEMLKTFAAAGLLVALGVFAIRRIRRRLPYEVWYWLHLTAYLIAFLGYEHQFLYGQEVAIPGFGRWFWICLHLFVLACVLWGRVVRPIGWNLRHRLTVLEVRPESEDTYSIYLGGRRLDRISAEAGQHFRWRFLARGCWWQSHPFSLSAAPNAEWLRLTVKVVGDLTKELPYLDPGTRVFAHGPFGAFTASRRVRPQALLIAGGSGIAPIRALLEDVPPGAVVIYRASRDTDLVLRDELDWLARQRGAHIWYVVGGRDEPGPRRVFSPRGLRELVPDVNRRDVYLCGPAGLVEAASNTLYRLGVPKRQIHLDPFEL